MDLRYTTLLGALLLSACFSPDADTDTLSDAESDGTDSETGQGPASSTSEPGSGGTTADAPSTSSDPTAEGSDSDGATEGGTTEGPTTTSGMDSTAGMSSGGADPFCGDGNIDPGEECDDGLDNNGLDQSCLPDCNLNVCGDGNLGPDEVCDDGADDNILESGACAPDCSTVIEEREIALSSTFGGGNHQPNPVGFADSQCAVGSRALFSVPGVRQATAGTPNTADAPIDWPLQPYTAYVRPDGTPIWVTDGTPLLGVRDGAVMDLVNSIYPECEAEPNICILYGWPVTTGMEQDWTPKLSDTCNGWSTDSGDFEFSVGEKTSVDSFLDDGVRPCSQATGDFIIVGTQPIFYCVEQ